MDPCDSGSLPKCCLVESDHCEAHSHQGECIPLALSPNKPLNSDPQYDDIPSNAAVAQLTTPYKGFEFVNFNARANGVSILRSVNGIISIGPNIPSFSVK